MYHYNWYDHSHICIDFFNNIVKRLVSIIFLASIQDGAIELERELGRVNYVIVMPMQLAKTSYTIAVTVIFILLSVILLYMDYYSLILVKLVNIPYQKDHNGNKQDLSAFCAILGYICNYGKTSIKNIKLVFETEL